VEEKKSSGNIDNPEILSPSLDTPASDLHGKIGNASRNPLASEEKKQALSQRLAEAFRDGIASTNPDYEKRPESRIPPLPRSTLQEPGAGRILDRVIQEGGSAAAVVGDKAANVLGAFVQLVKKAPSLTQKYVDAFREGAATVKAREGRERREDAPTGASKKGTPLDGRVILDRVVKVGESTAAFVREAVAVVNPGEVIGAGQKVRVCKKRINDLYIEIGSEAANSWNDGLVEMEKLDALIDELRKNEEEIHNLQAHLAEVAAMKKAGATRIRSPQTVKKEAVFTPAPDKADNRGKAVVPDAKPDEPFDHPAEVADMPQPDEPVDHTPEAEDLPQLEKRHDVTPDVPSEVAGVSVSQATDSELPASPSIPEETAGAEAAPQEEAGGEADRTKPEETEVNREKAKEYPTGARSGGSSGKHKKIR